MSRSKISTLLSATANFETQTVEIQYRDHNGNLSLLEIPAAILGTVAVGIMSQASRLAGAATMQSMLATRLQGFVRSDGARGVEFQLEQAVNLPVLVPSDGRATLRKILDDLDQNSTPEPSAVKARH